MKKLFLVLLLTFGLLGSGFAVAHETCSATAPCGATCYAAAPLFGGVSCFVQNGNALCTSYDRHGRIVSASTGCCVGCSIFP